MTSFSTIPDIISLGGTCDIFAVAWNNLRTKEKFFFYKNEITTGIRKTDTFYQHVLFIYKFEVWQGHLSSSLFEHRPVQERW